MSRTSEEARTTCKLFAACEDLGKYGNGSSDGYIRAANLAGVEEFYAPTRIEKVETVMLNNTLHNIPVLNGPSEFHTSQQLEKVHTTLPDEGEERSSVC